MKNMNIMTRLGASFVIATALVSCGGGSGGGTSTGGSTTPTTPSTPTVTVPGAPTGLAATVGNGQLSLAFTAPTSNGGAAITAYTATCSAAGTNKTATGSASPLVVTQLTNGTAYTCAVTATNSAGTGAASTSITATPVAPTTSFALASAAGSEGAAMAADYTCDGTGSSPQLSWSNPPNGTQEFALLMTTLPGDGTTKWNWVLYGIPGSSRALVKDNFAIGTTGVGSDGPFTGYQPPCSQGPGAKTYTFTLYALSAAPNLAGQSTPLTGTALTAAIASVSLGSATLNLTYTRPASASGSSTACGYLRSSLGGSTTGNASVACDANYGYVSSTSLPTHTMMNGITATNLQVPTAQNFLGANGWKIPLNPSIATSTVSAVDGPIGIAVNGVLIFNPCKQGGCQNGDTKVLGELDVCNGHAGRGDDYHYHAAPVCMMQGKSASYWDTHPVGWALDGFAIFGYNDADGKVASRDTVCGGNTNAVVNAPSGYAYHVTDASPYVLACFRGTPSPDLANQSSKFSPMRQPPVNPFKVSNMTLATDANDGYQVLQFTSALSFTTNETGSDSYSNAPGTYRIRYKQLAGSALLSALAQNGNANKSACWAFQFTDAAGTTTQPNVTYCR